MVRIKIDLTKVVLFLSTPATFTCHYRFSKGGEAHRSTTVMSCMSSLLHVLRIPIFFQASKLTSIIMKGTEVPNPRRSSVCDCTCVLRWGDGPIVSHVGVC